MAHTFFYTTLLTLFSVASTCSMELLVDTPEQQLMCACRYGIAHKVRALLTSKADVNVADNQGISPLHGVVEYSAREEQREKIVEHLLGRGADVNATTVDGFSVLHKAVQRHLPSEKIITTLIAAKADIEQKTPYGHTPLTLAVACGAHEAVKALLHAKAAVHCPGPRGWTALHYAAASGHVYADCIMQALLDAQADLEAQNADGQTALLLATKHVTSPQRVQTLIAARANVHHTDAYGNSALHYAAQNGFKNKTRLLLAAQSRARDKNKDGNSALDLAQSRWNNSEVVHMLRAATQ